MGKVVLGNLNRIDLLTTMVKTTVGESVVSQQADEEVLVVADTEENIRQICYQNEVYLPSTLLNDQVPDGAYVYFDLENYPFFQVAKEIISQEEGLKGVFRYRRTSNKNNSDLLLVSDLYVISSLFGEVTDFHLKRTDSSTLPKHIIIQACFGEAVMAHIEYTVSDDERIEMEWSGIKKILEFDSHEMRPISPGDKTLQPLTYTVDAILEHAHLIDQNFKGKFNAFKDLISRGGQS